MRLKRTEVKVKNVLLIAFLLLFAIFCIWIFWDGWHCDLEFDKCHVIEHRLQAAILGFITAVAIIMIPMGLLALLIQHGDKKITIPIPSFGEDKRINEILDEMAFTDNEDRLRELLKELEKLRG